MALVSFTVLTTWRRGRRLLLEEMAKQSCRSDDFIGTIGDVHRVHGTAIFMTSTKEGVPAALLHNLKHNQVLHERVVLLTVQTASTPYVNDLDRIYLHRLDEGFMRIVVRYGFMEDPDVPGALAQCSRFGETLRHDGNHLLRLPRDHHPAHAAARHRALARPPVRADVEERHQRHRLLQDSDQPRRRTGDATACYCSRG